MQRAPVVLCDLDGVVWLARRPLPKADDAVAMLRRAGHRVVFVTNNSYATRSDQEQHLFDIGIPARGDVLTSAMATGTLLEAGMRVLVCGGSGLIESVTERGAIAIEASSQQVDSANVDAVVVGFHRSFDYETMARANLAIRRGATFIASNEDPTYPTTEGPIPGGGSIVAAISVASGVLPIVAGKPHAPMARLVRSLVPGVDASSIMIGDRPSTDGRFAVEIGCRFALVHSDVSAEGEDTLTENSASFDIHLQGPSLWDVARRIVESQ